METICWQRGHYTAALYELLLGCYDKNTKTRGELWKKGFLADSYRESVVVGEGKQQVAGMVARAGSWEATSSITNRKQREQHGSQTRL